MPPTTAPTRWEALGLVLRAYTPNSGDAIRLYEAIERSRATLHPWLPWAMISHRSRAESEEWITQTHAKTLAASAKPADLDTAYIYGIFESSTGELLGGTGFNRLHPPTHNAETGYWVRSDRRREGIAVRALAASLSWAFTPQHEGGFGFRRVHIFVAEPNVASRGVPAKLDLSQVARTREDRWVDGHGWTDTLSWDVLAHEWDTRTHAKRR
jgi:RimJ/RimL family protein N-acetyltransferase